jgi:hypothetical protein
MKLFRAATRVQYNSLACKLGLRPCRRVAVVTSSICDGQTRSRDWRSAGRLPLEAAASADRCQHLPWSWALLTPEVFFLEPFLDNSHLPRRIFAR